MVYEVQIRDEMRHRSGMKLSSKVVRNGVGTLLWMFCLPVLSGWTQELHHFESTEKGMVIESVDEVPNPESALLSEQVQASVPLFDGSTESASEENGTTWHEVIGAFWTRFIGVQNDDVQSVDPELAEMAGFKDGLTATSKTSQQIASLSQSHSLKVMLDLYEKYRNSSNVSVEWVLDDELEALFSSTELTAEEKLGIYQAIHPLLVRQALGAQSVVSARKLRYSGQSMSRLHIEPMGIECVFGQRGIKFGLDSLDEGQKLNGRMIEVAPSDVSEYGFESSQMVCSAVPLAASQEHLIDDFQDVMTEALVALNAKDNDYIIESIHRLDTYLMGISRRLGYVASWNEHWHDAPISDWLCRLHVISLLLLEQDRFAELSSLERSIQAAFPKNGFYDRVVSQGMCQKHLPGGFRETFSRLTSENGNNYDWIAKHFSPKGLKKLDKNFSSWTKVGKKKKETKAIFDRRLLASWTAWCLGDYGRSERYAGNVTENRSRIVHPQLHSFGVMLSAVRGEVMDREALETYVRVVRLKSPALVYQTLSEAGRFWNKEMRQLAVDVIRQYPPGDAGPQAARLYLEYSEEMRDGMSAAHRIEIDKWLETEVRLAESDTGASRRRLVWLDDLVSNEDWPGIVRLSEIAGGDITHVPYRAFWKTAGEMAKTVIEAGEMPKTEEIYPEWENCFSTADSPQMWLTIASTCLSSP